MDPDCPDVDAMYEERTELPAGIDQDDTLALDPADESNYEDSDADPETGVVYGDLT